MKGITVLAIVLISISFVSGLEVQQKVEATVLSPEFVIHSPVEGFNYLDRRIPFNISTSESIERIDYKENNEIYPRFRRICIRNCDEDFFRNRNFRDGEHSITFRFYLYNGEFIEETVNFTVDTSPPRIIKTEPRKEFVNSHFSVEFLEENPEKLILFYGNNKTGIFEKEADLSECEKSLWRGKYSCSTGANLTLFEGQKINYWFRVIDIANNSDTSVPTIGLKVDKTKPVFESVGFEVNRRRVRFEIGINEENFERVSYKDLSDRNPRERTLCNRLNDGVCKGQIGLRDGDHEILLIAEDKAGNKETSSVIFNI